MHQGTLGVPDGSAMEAKSLLAVVYGAMLGARVFGDAAAFGAVVGGAIGLKLPAPVRADRKSRGRAQVVSAV